MWPSFVHGTNGIFLDLASAGKSLLIKACQLGKRITGMHLLSEQLSERHFLQRSLFPNVEPPEIERVAEVKRSINHLLGRFAVRSGETLALDDIYADEANDFDICDVRGKICF